MNKKNNKGQVFLLTVFIVSTAMFISILSLSPITNKIKQIKDMDYVYQAMSNAEKIFEISSYVSDDPNEFRNHLPDEINSILSYSSLTVSNIMNCGYYVTSTLGNCNIYTYSLGNEGKAISYVFQTSTFSIYPGTFYFGYKRQFSWLITEYPSN